MQYSILIWAELAVKLLDLEMVLEGSFTLSMGLEQ